MAFNNKIHHRHSIRLPEYDYSQPNAYFVTICSFQKECLFGEIMGGEMRVNEIGLIVQYWWNEIPQHFNNVFLDEAFVIMPNHVHGIIWIRDVGIESTRSLHCSVGADRCVRPMQRSCMDASASADTIKTDDHTYVDQSVQRGSVTHDGHIDSSIQYGEGGHIGPPLPKIIQWFKTMTTNMYFKYMKQNGLEFGGKPWQRNYYERIIRSDRELYNVRKYIAENPLKWEEDPERPVVNINDFR
jgi:REP element-mobilizing transposase RayT